MRIGIAGAGGIARACAAWLASQGHEVTMWSPRGAGTQGLRAAPLKASGLVDGAWPVAVADTAAQLAEASEALILAVPSNGHRMVIDALAPEMHDGMALFISATASLSALHAHETFRRLGKRVSVAASGTTMLTARTEGSSSVRIMTRRQKLGLSVLPGEQAGAARALWSGLFGDVFSTDANALASTLSNINPIAHAPLALFNWTRIERAEAWPQYHYMTPDVSRVIGELDRERIAVAAAFGLSLRGIEAHFAASFGTVAQDLAGIAAELHAKRGGPPGPVSTDTRYVTEDVPYGLVFTTQLARIVGVACPATQAIIAALGLIAGREAMTANDLIEPLGLDRESREGLLRRL